ncbi:MAG: acyltransferase domain-containing protein, partial [Planctomycetes bacterium]|nr:acyltransferase domain-containing protein [Planctomycetota bacterium]
MTAAHQSNADPTTFPELLARRAIEQTERRIFTFLSGGEQETGHLTYGELDRQARVIAAEIAKIGARGERVLLVYPTGLDFVSAFFGCLYAGAVAVPAPPPDPARLRRTLPRIEAIVEDASPVAVLTTAEGLALARSVFEQMPRLAGMVWIPTDSLGGDGPLPPADSFPPPHETAVAFLQYTSGSTSAPKGTEITHGGLVANSRAIRDAWGFTPESVDVVWVPNHHDDGLVHGLLQPVFGGSHGVLLPPVAVIQRPRVWLEAISRYRATHSGGPNFGYEIARRKVPAECLPHLDLSSWTVAYNAAEPVRPETLESFRDAFAPCGFRWTTFQPCYGLAESTLLVTSKRLAEEPRFLSIDIRALEREHRVVPVSRGAPGGRTISSCGAPVAGTTIAIADPRSGRRLSPGTVGEIWLAGPSCARGYWGKPEATAETFGARLADGEGPFLRTGDLGFLLEGELYVTGRLKDVIILRGQNHHAHDLEWAIQSCHPAIRPGSAAAFPVEEGGEERVAMVVEADPRALGDGGEAALAPVYDAIREAVSEAHGVTVHAIAILRPGALPKTSSGKVQRGACAAAFRAGELDEIGRSLLVPEQATPAPAALPPPAPSKERTQEEVAAIVAEGLTLGERRLDPDTPFGAYGLDSVSATALAERLGERFGLAFAPSLLWNHPTLASLAAHIAERLAESRCPPATGTDGAGSGSTAPRSIALPREAERRLHEPIAVLGMSLRVPGANDAGAFWSRLAEGFDGIREVPPDRWDIDLFHDPDRSAPGRMTTRWGGFLDCAVDRFDPTFFAIAPREAEHMDPQQRLLLEVTWEALEEAGIVPESLQRSATGVFVGICGTDYRSLSISDIPAVGAYDTSGNACSIVANRLSYIFDLRGPSFAVDTACSSGLLALHLACRSLRARECDMAIVGATNLVLTPHITISFSKFGAMAPDGRCKTFDERADGYVRGEGIVSVILKRLSDVRPGDPVLALIRGTATNQDGTTAGLTAPNGLAQQAVIRLALEDAGTDPAGIGFVECHGTGTALGDPIEVEALAAVYGQAPGPVALGALISSVGHLEGAAGLAGMAKAVLALQRGAIPPNLHFRRLNPQISFAGTSFYVPTELRPWPRGPQPRLAAVSSFGFGGSNVHVILEEPPPAPERGDSSPPLRPFLLPVSAKTPEALGEAALLFAGRVRSAPAGELSDICHTASLRRSHHEHRLVAAAEDGPTLAEILEAFSRGETRPGLVSAAVQPGLERRIAFVFSGQGSQWPGMARALFEREPAFREAIERCEIAFRSHVEFSLRSALMEGSGEIERIDTIQPTLFAVQVALAALWQTWGIEPDAVVGHSMGEVAAAHVAGALTLDDAARVICRRSRLLLAVRGAGAMAMVELGLDEARQAIRGLEHAVSVAAANSPRSTILSGDRGVLAEILGELEARGVFCRWVKVDVASHSPQMDPLRKSLLGELDGLRPRPARIPIYSTVLASPVDGAGLDADYWSRNLREPVLFAPAVSRLVADGHTTFVELAPHPILAPAVEQCLKSAGCRGTVVGSLRRDDDDRISMLVALGALHASGVAVPFERLYPDGGRIVPLPAYPWQRDRYWLERPPFTPSGLASRADGFRSAHPFLGAAVSSSLHPEERLFEPDISTGELPYLKDHQVLGRVFFPAAGFIEAILAAGLGETPAGAGSGPGARIEDLRILTPLDLSADTSLRVQVASKPSGPGAAEIRIASAPRSGAGNPGTGEAGTGEAGSWTVHATATFHLAEPETGPAESQDLDSLRSRLPERIAGAEHYRAVAERGLAYGPAFQGVEEIARRDGEALARIRLPKESSKGAARYRLHPALLDACLQAIAGALPRGGTDDGTFVPAGARAIQFRRRPEMETESARIHAHVVVGALPAPDAGAFDADVTLLDDSGAVLARIEGLAVRRLGRESGAGSAAGMAKAVLEPVWRRTGRRAGATSTPVGVSWLLLLDPEGTIGERIAADLSARGDKVVAVAAAGSGAASRGFARCRVLDPWRPEDLARFLS